MVYESRLFRYGILSKAAEATMQRKGAQKERGPSRGANVSASTPSAREPGHTLSEKTEPKLVEAPQRGGSSRTREQARVEAPGRQAASAPIIETQVGNEPEHRHFPRARLATRFELWREEEGQRTFSATLVSQNVSVSGAFLESTFFLPVGTQLQVRFSLEEGAEPVLARAEIIREERAHAGGRSGFGIRFMEFTGQSEISLARLFLGMRLRTFAEEYLRSRRARSLPNELERAVDVLAAWELLKATSPGDPWRGE